MSGAIIGVIERNLPQSYSYYVPEASYTWKGGERGSMGLLELPPLTRTILSRPFRSVPGDPVGASN